MNPRTPLRFRAVTTAMAACGLALLGACGGGSDTDAAQPDVEGEAPSGRPPVMLRIATFNIHELSREQLDDVDADGAGRDLQALAAARIIQRVRPDVLVLNEIDLDVEQDDAAHNARLFAERYLARGDSPIEYPHAFAAPSNTGLLTGFDLDGDGRVATDEDRGSRAHGGDCFGYGAYPGQYAMALLSRYPLASGVPVRTFQRFLWSDLPGHHIPPGFYGDDELAILRLSSKSHWDVPVSVDGRVLHLWLSHPTPPAFDGPEDRNGRRNFDEIKLWKLYLDDSDALVDDGGGRGGFGRDAPFVIAGDLNADSASPAVYDGSNAIDQLLVHPRIHDPADRVSSRGAEEHRRAAAEDLRAESEKEAAALAARPGGAQATAKFLGGRRVDYLLPSAELEVVDGGVFWPTASEDPEGAGLAEAASDHHLVWLDLRWSG